MLTASSPNPASGGSAKKAAREAARAERKADVDRVERVAELFIERYVKRSGRVGAGWGKEVERLFKIEILPRIGAKRIGDVKKRDINDILDAIADRGSPINGKSLLCGVAQVFQLGAR